MVHTNSLKHTSFFQNAEEITIPTVARQTIVTLVELGCLVRHQGRKWIAFTAHSRSWLQQPDLYQLAADLDSNSSFKRCRLSKYSILLHSVELLSTDRAGAVLNPKEGLRASSLQVVAGLSSISVSFVLVELRHTINSRKKRDIHHGTNWLRG